MWKKVSIQIILFLLIIFLIFFTYKIYFKSEENTFKDKKLTLLKKISRILKMIKLELEKIDEDSNLIKNLKYISKDTSREMSI